MKQVKYISEVQFASWNVGWIGIDAMQRNTKRGLLPMASVHVSVAQYRLSTVAIIAYSR